MLNAPLGEVLEVIDSRNNTTVYSYDDAGRLEHITRADEVTTNKFDALGRLELVTLVKGNVLKHQQKFDYLTNSPLLETKTETIGNKAYSITYAYDDKYERLMSETYHDGFKVSYGYSATGEVTNVKAKPLNKDEKTIWQLNAISALGQIEKFTQNGNLVTNMQYTAKGLPDYIKTVNGNTVLMHYDYNFTTDGDLDFRHDKVTENKEVFTYDDLNHQLTGWSLYNNAGGNNYTTRRGGGAMQFEANGNIERKECNQFLGGDAETFFEYGNPDNNAGPHALSGYYGNPVYKHQQKITHTSFNKVDNVKLKDINNNPLKQLSITYGVDDQRRLTEFFAADGVTCKLKRYYFDNYEEEVKGDGTTRTIHYISGGNGLAAMYISDDANGKTGFYFAHTDYQGSLTGLSNASGTIVERYAYDPWGNRRNALSWEQALNTEGKYIYTSRGYTMHEHLDDYGLINMNGRVYDPLISRFLSPDPFVQAPNMAMGFNRYAYCLNNPLIYTDPTGYKWKWKYLNPVYWMSEGMQWINDNTTGLREAMVDIGVPDFMIGVNYNGGAGNFNYNASLNGQQVFSSTYWDKMVNAPAVVNGAIADMHFANMWNPHAFYEMGSGSGYFMNNAYSKQELASTGGVVDLAATLSPEEFKQLLKKMLHQEYDAISFELGISIDAIVSASRSYGGVLLLTGNDIGKAGVISSSASGKGNLGASFNQTRTHFYTVGRLSETHERKDYAGVFHSATVTFSVGAFISAGAGASYSYVNKGLKIIGIQHIVGVGISPKWMKGSVDFNKGNTQIIKNFSMLPAVSRGILYKL